MAAAYMNEAYKPQVHVPQDVRNTLASMQTAGYILGVVSNREKPYQEELKELKLASHFTFSLAAGEISSYKPDPAIFERALELAGTSAQETVYVGDNYFADIVGSRRAGLRPVLYDPINLFPEADCAVIKSFDELLSIVGHV
jgi:putative hydrolase of the HAD superfamily